MRIVSLLPSATEIVHALGAGPDLVGRSAECDYPPEVRHLPVVMRPRTLDASEPSAAIDRRVQRSLDRRESLYELDEDRLLALRPDVLLTQDLCAVCSVTEAEVATACRRQGLATNVVSVSPTSLDEVAASIETIGASIGRPAESAALSARFRARTRRAVDPSVGRPRVALVEWLDPPILAGLWATEMIVAAGGEPVNAGSDRKSVRTDWTTIRSSRPDLVVISPCSFDVARTRAEMGRSELAPVLASLDAPIGVVAADEAYFSRPGPRLADGVELLRALLHGGTPNGPMPAEWVVSPSTTGAIA